MTISYTLDVSQTGSTSIFRLLFRWRGSIWKAVFDQLIIWTIVYLIISVIYRYVLSTDVQNVFDWIVKYLNTGLDSHIPLTFMLGFFVSFVVGRWGSILSGLGWIDDSAVAFATHIHGHDENTQILRRSLVRYMVLSQALVLRDISLQVRKRFPTLETMIAAGLLTKEELKVIDRIPDAYSRYWIPISWCNQHLVEARKYQKISSDYVMEKMTHEIQTFRHGLSTLLRYDWVPIPLVYPQLILLAVRLYFFVCLFSRQFLRDSEHKDLWLPIATMIQFIVYMGWMKVAEALLNPLGEDDDDLECNYVIDKNLITGMTLVDVGSENAPKLHRDMFWGNDHIAPLYSLEAAERTVHPLVGSASKVNLVKNVNTITMTPHKTRLVKMSDAEIEQAAKVVDVKEHNDKHSVMKRTARSEDPDKTLSMIRKRHESAGPRGNGSSHEVEVPARFDRISPRILQPPPGVIEHHSPYDTHQIPHPDERNYRRW